MSGTSPSDTDAGFDIADLIARALLQVDRAERTPEATGDADPEGTSGADRVARPRWGVSFGSQPTQNGDQHHRPDPGPAPAVPVSWGEPVPATTTFDSRAEGALPADAPASDPLAAPEWHHSGPDEVAFGSEPFAEPVGEPVAEPSWGEPAPWAALELPMPTAGHDGAEVPWFQPAGDPVDSAGPAVVDRPDEPTAVPVPVESSTVEPASAQMSLEVTADSTTVDDSPQALQPTEALQPTQPTQPTEALQPTEPTQPTAVSAPAVPPAAPLFGRRAGAPARSVGLTRSSRSPRPATARVQQAEAGVFRLVVEWVLTFAVAGVIAVLVNQFVITTYRIPSPSMVPTLAEQDRILVNRLSYEFHGLHRGDVVVFDRPANMMAGPNDPKVLVKRVIGLPGERVEGRGGRVLVDGRPLTESYLNEGGSTDEFAPVLVPEGAMFVMGDNRRVSQDSRSFGPVAQENIVGRAFVRVWPLQRFGAT